MKYFREKLADAVKHSHSFCCIGLDPVIEKMPLNLKKEQHPFYQFNKAIIDATFDLACAYKPNSAFYEALGADGIKELKMTCDYIHDTYPDMPIILDAKRGDISSTNEGYAQYAFDYLQVDAITLHPYLGHEALRVFLNKKDKGCFILCRTSNPGAGEFQDLNSGGKPFYEVVAQNVATKWNKNDNCMLVVGATYPAELAKIRKIVGDMTILTPGIGAQGGNLQTILQAGLNSRRSGLIISASRSIIYVSNRDDFAGRAKEEMLSLKSQINKNISD